MMVPRGLGTVVSMVVYGRLLGGADPRRLVSFGLLMVALSLWLMSGFDTQVDAWTIAYTGVLQGLGLGFVYSPLSTMAFGTLALRYRVEGAAMFSLTRNLGGSIGISIVIAILAENIQVNHSVLGESLTPFRDALRQPWLPDAWDWTKLSGLMALDRELTRQATMIAFTNDFLFIMWVTLGAMPLLFLLRAPRRGATEPRPTRE
jgi:MFS transporter, DHA2 family, multidrug resistance protein